MSTESEQKTELQNKIWKIANELRGAVDGWDFKQYVLGALFYRFISENFSNHIEGEEDGDDSICYADLSDDDPRLTHDVIKDIILVKGYFIYPSQLFVNVVKNAHTNENLNADLKVIFDCIEKSAKGYASENNIKGLFADFDTTSSRLGNSVKDKNDRLTKVLKGVAELDFGDFKDNQIDLFGDAYEFLISNYAANAGKSGGEFFTPQNVSKLIARLAVHGKTSINKVYDPTCGSGSLLLQIKKQFKDHFVKDGYFGQEINHTTYNLARMNMFLHNISYNKFKIALCNTLTNPSFLDEKPFDVIISNPPYSVKWIGDDDPTLINDERFAPAGVLAPKSKSDFAFILHTLNYLSVKGSAVIVVFPGIFYRGGVEKKIRKYLIDNNVVETVIQLPSDLFFNTRISTCILILSKNKSDNKTQFINASEFYKKETNNNVLTDTHIDEIIKHFTEKQDVPHICKMVENDVIAANDYNLSVSCYVEAKDDREIIDINQLNNEINQTVSKISQLRNEINKIVEKIGG